MKKMIVIALALFLAIPAFTQEYELSRKEQKKLQKELRKEQQAEEAAKRMDISRLLVEHRKFVLEADRLRDKRGNMVNVSSMINFIACDSVRGVIQIGSNQYVGINGVGGITVEGPIANYKSSYNVKNSSITVSYNLRTTAGTYDVRMSIYGEGRAEATISSNWPGRVNYIGYLIPPALSKVYKGISY